MQVNGLRNWFIGLLCLAIGVLPAGSAFARALPAQAANHAQHQAIKAASAKPVAAQVTADTATAQTAADHANCHKAAKAGVPAASATSTLAASTMTPAASDTGTSHDGNCCPDGKGCTGLCLTKCAQVLGIVAPDVHDAPLIADLFIDLASRAPEGRSIRPAPPPPRT